jgi:Ca2+/Na+ antiporter
MDDTEIIYEFNTDDFKELVDSTGGKSPFTYQPTRVTIRGTIIFILATIVIYFTAFYFEPISFLIIIGVFFSIVGIVFTIFRLYKYKKWRKDITRYLLLMQGKKCRLSVKNGFIKMIKMRRTVVENLKETKCTIFRDVVISCMIKQYIDRTTIFSIHFLSQPSLKAESSVKFLVQTKLFSKHKRRKRHRRLYCNLSSYPSFFFRAASVISL